MAGICLSAPCAPYGCSVTVSLQQSHQLNETQQLRLDSGKERSRRVTPHLYFGSSAKSHKVDSGI